MIPGTYKPTFQKHRAFRPHALPPSLMLPIPTARVIEEATHLLGKVEMCRTLLPNADLLTYSSLQREALASSTIENTIASPEELILYQISHQAERQAVREVANYGVALSWGCEEIRTRPITTNLILELHRILLRDVRGASSGGRFKSAQNFIGSRREDTIEKALFVPSAPEDVGDLMSALECYINGENAEPKVVQCALTHYQFETIHPFSDGNGRVGRLLIVLQLIQSGVLSAPLIYPSVYFERSRGEYYRRLQDVRDHGAWNDWISYFAQGVVQQCEETLQFTQTIMTLQKQLRAQIGSVRRRASYSEVLDAFFRQPVRTIRQISDEARITPNSVQAALEGLQELGLVKEISGKQKGRTYLCVPIANAIFGGEIRTQERRHGDEGPEQT